MKTDLRNLHKEQLLVLSNDLRGNQQRLKVKKNTISNLFRYKGRQDNNARLVDLSHLNKPLYLDKKNKTLDVQGLTTYEDIVDFVLPYGLLPTITPELKHITVGGVTVGIGIESNCYRYGFVHDGLLEADVLLASGEIVTCSPTNKYADLFYGLANSYGSLGYILRAKIKLHTVSPYVQLTTSHYDDTKSLLKAIKLASQDPGIDYVESLVYTPHKQYLTISKHVAKPTNLQSIYGGNIFYKAISVPGTFTLPTKEYIFRYDPEWFWNIPETVPYKLFRKLAPRSTRNSSFYTRYNNWVAKYSNHAERDIKDQTLEKFIQDWEVPWSQAQGLLDFALGNIDMEWRPWLITIIKTPARATNYPMRKNELYMNLGAYSFAKKKLGKPAYQNTKLMDDYCFKHEGIKMLYSTTFLQEKEFNRVYNGHGYGKLKSKYDPHGLLPTLFEKTVKAF